MYSLFCEVKFWTLKNDIQIQNTDFGAFRYYDKKEIDECPYLEGKKSYCCQRGTTFLLKNKRPLKLKDNLKELEQQLANNKIVFYEWKNDNILYIVINTGLIIKIGVNASTKDIYKITFDRFLIGKLLSDNICDVLSTKTHLVISYNENQLTIVNYSKPSFAINETQKLSKLEPKVQLVDLYGPSGRRVERHLSCNKSGDMILTWWHSTRNEVYPWSPLVKDEDRANIHFYSLEGTKIDLLSFYKTEFDLINVMFSKIKSSLIWLIEQKVSKKGDVVIVYSSYEILRKTLKRISITSIPLQTQICCHSISPDEEKLVLGCIDGSLILFDEPKGITRMVKTAFIPNLVSWHTDGALIIIANERSQFQCFDFALSYLKIQLLSEDVAVSNILDLASYFKSQPSLLYIKWNKKPDVSIYTDRFIMSDGLLFLAFENGPLGVLKLIGGGGLLNDVQNSGLTADVITRQYILYNQSDKALNLLLSLNWNTNGSTCLAALYHIANHIFRQPFTPEKEIILEAALGSFYSPIRPLTKLSENEFGNQVRDLTRRFFYHLLRYRLYEKAYCLAIDLSNADLFIDLYHCAKLLKDHEMANACKSKFEEFSSLSDSSSHSYVSHTSSCSCSESTTDNEDNESAILPPLPQISVKKAKASRIPPLPDVNQYNKSRESAFFNCSSTYVPTDAINNFYTESPLGLFNANEPATSSTSFKEFYSSILNHSPRFIEPNHSNNLVSTSKFSYPHEIRTCFSENENKKVNFTSLESISQRPIELKTEKPSLPLSSHSDAQKGVENTCDMSLNLNLKEHEEQKNNYSSNYNIPYIMDLGPSKFKASDNLRPSRMYVSNNFCKPPPVQYKTFESLVSSSFEMDLISSGEKSGLGTNHSMHFKNATLMPKNATVRTEQCTLNPKINDSNTNMLLQRPLQFVPNAYSKSLIKPMNAHGAKQKVKFSDTVTQIVVPDISKISIEDETWISQHKARNNRTLKPLVLSKNSNQFRTTVSRSDQHRIHDEEEKNGSIKVIHFGVV